MTIWVSRVELSEARRHLRNVDDRTYSSGDWLARFVPRGDLSRCSNGGAEPGLFDYLVGRHLYDQWH